MKRSFWVFGDYRNYFQNRVTLQLLSRATDLAKTVKAEVCAVVFGHRTKAYVKEYIAHGANKVYVIDDPKAASYNVEIYAALLSDLARKHQPEIILVGATAFGRELAPRAAKRLGTGLTADCVELELTEEGLLLQRAPAFGGNLLAEIITPEHRPQMATVRAGIFKEIPHDNTLVGEVIHLTPSKRLLSSRVRLLSSRRQPRRENKLEEARVVVCGGRGMGSKLKFKKIPELAKLMGGEVGATRPVVYANWAGPESLVGQAGKNIEPKLLFSFGISGAIQHTAAFNDAGFIIAVNKNPNATMMKMADVAIVADANQLCAALIKAFKERIRA